MPKITKRETDRIKVPFDGKERFIWDEGNGSLKGFGIRVKPSGAASFLIQYRNKEGRTRRLVLGKVGTLTADQARALARERLGEVAKGADPSAERQAVRSAMTVAELCDAYLRHATGRVKPSTLAMDRSRIETHVKPLIGRLSVRSVTSADIERMKADILAGKTARPRGASGSSRGGAVTGGPGVAARTIGMLGTILEYAVGTLKLISTNPARGVRKPPDQKQRRFLNAEQIAGLGTALREAEFDAVNPTALAAIRLLLLTGFRRMEVLALPLAWVDVKGHCVRFGDTKSGYQIRAIGSPALRVITELRRPADSKWAFAAERGKGHFVGLPKILDRICRRAEIEGVTVHILRHSFAATAAEMGFTELTIAGLLGHSVPGVTARYAHVADSALVAAANRVSQRIADLLDGRTDAENVVELPRRAG